MSQEENNGVLVEQVGSYSAGTTDQERADILANALGEKQVDESAAQVEEEPPVEQEEQAEEKPKEDEFASKFAALSRREKELRQREADIEARISELEERAKKYEGYEDLDERIRNKPFEVLGEKGIDFETLAKMALEGNGEPTTEMQIQRLREDMENKYMKEVENLRKELEEKEKQAEEQKYNEVIEDYKYELNEFIDQNSENYELIKLQGASDLVYEVVEEHYNETGRILSNEEACEHVENYLLEEAKKALNVNKIKSMFGQKEPGAQEPKPTPKTGVNTLSNTESATVPSSTSRVMSDEESKREAAKLIRWVE
jgi:hypothetical protein